MSDDQTAADRSAKYYALPQALRLAEDCDNSMHDFSQAAAELRRLHAENERLRVAVLGQSADLATLRAQNYETQSLLKGAEAECDALKQRLGQHDACNGVMGERGYVPECISLRAERDALRAEVAALQSQVNAFYLGTSESRLLAMTKECDALRSDAERWKFVLRHSWKDLQRVRVLAGIKTDSVLGPNWQDAVDDLLEAAGTAEQAIAARAVLKEVKNV